MLDNHTVSRSLHGRSLALVFAGMTSTGTHHLMLRDDNGSLLLVGTARLGWNIYKVDGTPGRHLCTTLFRAFRPRLYGNTVTADEIFYAVPDDRALHLEYGLNEDCVQRLQRLDQDGLDTVLDQIGLTLRSADPIPAVTGA